VLHIFLVVCAVLLCAMYRYIHCNVAMWFIVNVLQLSNKTILHCSTLMVNVSHSITQRVVPISQSYVVLR
jgi:protein gp37